MPEITSRDQTGNRMHLAPEQIEECLLQFHPRTEVDDQGLTRVIYEHSGQTFAFQGREETPLYPAIEQSQPVGIGREAFWMTHPNNQIPPTYKEEQKETMRALGLNDAAISEMESQDVLEWQDKRDKYLSYSSKLAEFQKANKDKDRHLIVERSLFGVIGLLKELNPEDPKWGQQLEKLAAGEYDDEALDIIDRITAVELSYEREDHGRELSMPVGEAVVVAALMGDEGAQKVVSGALEFQRDLDDKYRRSTILEQQQRLEGVEAFLPEDLVVVHATAYKPEKNDKGYQVQTLHDAVGYPRATIHTAINHKVDNVAFHSWDSQPYVLIAGFDQVVAANGSPNSINGADTWWSFNPGENMTFPDATLLAPGGDLEGLFVRQGDGSVLYKTEGVSPSDIEQGAEELGHNFIAKIESTLQDDKGDKVALSSEMGQLLVGQVIRDALVEKVIVQERGLELLRQSDDKSMEPETQTRLFAMAAQQGLNISGHLHAEDSGFMEGRLADGHDFAPLIRDPRFRRVAYASGMAEAGSRAREIYLLNRQLG
jgi:hypothetical protein